MVDHGSGDIPTRLFAEYVQRTEAGESLDFYAFCDEHPEEAEELSRLKANHEELIKALGDLLPSSTLSGRIKARHGSEADPNIRLEDECSSSVLTTQLIDRLSCRGEGYGRYKLKGEIDRGGQGAVLRVWDEDLRRNLAMKIMLGQVDIEATGDTPPVDSKTLGRFLEEAQVTSQLDHPGIVPVHELGLDAEGRVYFTMKLVKGETLSSVFEKVKTNEDGWTKTRALGVLLKVCEAMAYAHDKGVIHRDLKPTNIMVGRFGEVYVMDWGLARVMGKEDAKDIRIKPAVMPTSELLSDRRDHAGTPDSPLITMDGDVVGTPAYMSPEQARGELDQMGPWSDVYSVGAMLYELLAGHMPYVKPGERCSPHRIVYQVQEGPPDSLQDRPPGTHPELVAICKRAMSRSSEDRYGTTLRVAGDLQAFLEGRVVQAYGGGSFHALRKWIDRNRAVSCSILFGLIATSLVPVAALSLDARKQAEMRRDEILYLTNPNSGDEERRDALLAIGHRILDGHGDARDGYVFVLNSIQRTLNGNQVQSGPVLHLTVPIAARHTADFPRGLGIRLQVTFSSESVSLLESFEQSTGGILEGIASREGSYGAGVQFTAPFGNHEIEAQYRCQLIRIIEEPVGDEQSSRLGRLRKSDYELIGEAIVLPGVTWSGSVVPELPEDYPIPVEWDDVLGPDERIESFVRKGKTGASEIVLEMPIPPFRVPAEFNVAGIQLDQAAATFIFERDDGDVVSSTYLVKLPFELQLTPYGVRLSVPGANESIADTVQLFREDMMIRGRRFSIVLPTPVDFSLLDAEASVSVTIDSDRSWQRTTSETPYVQSKLRIPVSFEEMRDRK